jgi:hypothetical protein
MKPLRPIAHHLGRSRRCPAPAEGDFLFAPASDPAQARPHAYAEAPFVSPGSDRPPAQALGWPARGCHPEAQSAQPRYSTL